MSDCVGCGFCCLKAPCIEATRRIGLAALKQQGLKCPYLEWDGERHRCLLVKAGSKQEKKIMRRKLSIGAGCCSGLNTWRREPIRDRRNG